VKLQTIICSTRPNRVWPHIARWFHGLAEAHGDFEATLVDLADFNLPIFNEPWHPRLRPRLSAMAASRAGSAPCKWPSRC